MSRFDSSFLPGTLGASDLSSRARRDASQESFGDASFRAPSQVRRKFFFPLNYVADYEYPLIVWLPSDGFNENQIDHVMPHISVRNFVGVGVHGSRAVDSRGDRFEWSTSAAGIGQAHDAVMTAIGEAKKRFSLHSQRIVLAGYGSGGTMAMRIAMRDPRCFAGAASLGGRMPKNSMKQYDALRDRRLPMLWQWANGNVDYTQEQLSQDCQMAMAIGSQVEIRQYPGDDEMDTVVLSDLNDWIMRTVIPGNRHVANQTNASPRLYSVN